MRIAALLLQLGQQEGQRRRDLERQALQLRGQREQPWRHGDGGGDMSWGAEDDVYPDVYPRSLRCSPERKNVRASLFSLSRLNAPRDRPCKEFVPWSPFSSTHHVLVTLFLRQDEPKDSYPLIPFPGNS